MGTADLQTGLGSGDVGSLWARRISKSGVQGSSGDVGMNQDANQIFHVAVG